MYNVKCLSKITLGPFDFAKADSFSFIIFFLLNKTNKSSYKQPSQMMTCGIVKVL